MSPLRQGAALGFLVLLLAATRAGAVMVVTDFDSLSYNNSSNNSIGTSYQSGGFTFSSSGLFVYGRNHVSHPGSGAIYPTSGSLITITRTDGGVFNFYGGHFAERSTSSANTIGISGTRAEGGTANATARLDGGAVNSQLFAFGNLTGITSLTISGSNQLDRLVFSNGVSPGPSDATIHFNHATPGTVAASYQENTYALSSSTPGALSVASTMNDSQGLAASGSATIDLSHAGGLFALRGFEIQSAIGLGGSFRLTLTAESGATHVSSLFSGGSYDQAALLTLFGGQPFAETITSARFENTTGTDVMLDNIQAIPEPSVALLAALGLLFVGARNSFRPCRWRTLRSPAIIPTPL
jgi:hypothetical protein